MLLPLMWSNKCPNSKHWRKLKTLTAAIENQPLFIRRKKPRYPITSALPPPDRHTQQRLVYLIRSMQYCMQLHQSCITYQSLKLEVSFTFVNSVRVYFSRISTAVYYIVVNAPAFTWSRTLRSSFMRSSKVSACFDRVRCFSSRSFISPSQRVSMTALSVCKLSILALI